MHDRAEKTLYRARKDGGGLPGASYPSALFASWLVKPCLHALLPSLVEVVVGDLVVVLGHRDREEPRAEDADERRRKKKKE
jgi:hypothetical protein